MRHHYKITKKYSQRGPETPVPSHCANLNDAKIFINEKLHEDSSQGIQAIYLIYEDGDLHSEYDQSAMKPLTKPKEESEGSGSSGKGKGASFKPTPFNMAPKPSGTPHSWIKEDEDEEDKEK